jgi:hypothetical protein
MPRYFFDTRDGDTTARDEIGLEFDELEAVEREALKALPDLARGAVPDGHRDFVVNVRDEAGRPVLRASLSLNVVRFVYVSR